MTVCRLMGLWSGLVMDLSVEHALCLVLWPVGIFNCGFMIVLAVVL